MFNSYSSKCTGSKSELVFNRTELSTVNPFKTESHLIGLSGKLVVHACDVFWHHAELALVRARRKTHLIAKDSNLRTIMFNVSIIWNPQHEISLLKNLLISDNFLWPVNFYLFNNIMVSELFYLIWSEIAIACFAAQANKWSEPTKVVNIDSGKVSLDSQINLS